MLERLRALVRGFLLAAKDHDDAALRIELDDHVGAFVSHPNVVVVVDADGMGEGPSVKIVANLAKKLSVGREFQELGCGGTVRGAGRIAAREHEDMPLGVDGYADGLAEI